MSRNRLGTGKVVPPGTVFGRLTTLESCNSVGQRVACSCECGGSHTPLLSNLKNGTTHSCGCAPRGAIRHGMASRGAEHPVWKAWSSMLQRCRDPNADNYERYGGRGIRVCAHWEKFENFRDDMLQSWTPGMSLERDDVDGNYEKSNCRWIPVARQARNRRSTRWVEVNGRRMSLAEAVDTYAAASKRTTLARIYDLGWSVADALTTSARSK